MSDEAMTIERVMSYLFSQEWSYRHSQGYSADKDREIRELTWWYHRGFALLSEIRRGVKK